MVETINSTDANEKLAALRKAQTMQKQAYERKRTEMMGQKKGGITLSMVGNGQMTLEQMNLDRNVEFQGDAYNPFAQKNNQKIDLSLHAQNAYMGRSNTVGGKLWSPEQEAQQQTAQLAPSTQPVNVANELDDLEDIDLDAPTQSQQNALKDISKQQNQPPESSPTHREAERK